jgi:membrane protein
VSGSIAVPLGDVLGLSLATVKFWAIVKWPLIMLCVVCMVNLLYTRTPSFRPVSVAWISPGTYMFLLTWIFATIGFNYYISNFANYDKIYGSLAGAVIILLWLWITNVALLLGAELNSEVARGRELESRAVAEREQQLPPRPGQAIAHDSAKAEGN